MLRIFRQQRFHDCQVVLKSFSGVGDIRGLVFHHQVEVVTHRDGKQIDYFEGLVPAVRSNGGRSAGFIDCISSYSLSVVAVAMKGTGTSSSRASPK